MKKLIMIMLVSLTGICAQAQTAKSQYKISNKFSVEGDGSWDYLSIDETTNLLYISHGTMVQVLNVTTGKLAGTIPDTKGVHGIALVKNLKKGYISDGKDTAVTVFDLEKLVTLKKIKVTGNNPDAIMYDAFSERIFTFNGRSNNISVIDVKTDKIIGTIELEGKPEFAVSDGKGKVYVNIEDKSKICMFNPVTMKVEATWSIAPGEEPSGLALDNETHRLFSVCDKMMVILDALTGKVITTVTIGDRVDGVAFDPKTKRAYSSNGDGTMTVVQEVDANTFKVVENVATQKGARTITVNKTTHKLYLPTAEFGEAPAPTKDNAHPRPAIKPGTFVILEVEQVK